MFANFLFRSDAGVIIGALKIKLCSIKSNLITLCLTTQSTGVDGSSSASLLFFVEDSKVLAQYG
jgi:hypothetical protein